MSNEASRQLEDFYQDMDEDMEDGDEEFYPDDEAEDEDEDDYELYVEDMDNVTGVYDEDEEDMDYVLEEDDDDEEEDDDGTTTLYNIVELLAGGATSSEQRTALLARLLAGPSNGTRSGGVRLSSILSPEERAREAEERRKRDRWWEPQIEPHPRGLALLRSGEFGRVGPWQRGSSRMGGKRGWNARASVNPSIVDAIPNTNGTIVASYPSIPYVGQYAGEDHSLFYTATQNFTLHLYNTAQSKPTEKRGSANGNAQQAHMPVHDDDEDEDDDDMYPWSSWPTGRRRMPTEDTSLKKIKSVQGVPGQWTVTDCDADKKGERMIYSSITPHVYMLHTGEDDSDHVELNFSSGNRRQTGWGDDFGIWSIRFSADGKEVVAGASDGKIMVYDIAQERRSLSVAGHADDVNAVCFADESSTNILVSGSDDGYVKVWDRRSLSSSTPSGILVGATEGITYTSPKGDGRYIIANSKDQAARLYDLRKMRSPGEFTSEPDAVSRHGFPRYDYRMQRYPPPRLLAHPKDCSVMTFRGHSVLRTLIRCHFSPRESTGQSYIYSGSADGLIHIWSIDGRVVQVLNRAESIPLHTPSGGYTDPSAPERRRPPRYSASPDESGTAYAVRDVAWHGFEPTLMSTCWEVQGSYRRGGTIAKHEWKGLGKGGLRRLEDWVEKDAAERTR